MQLGQQNTGPAGDFAPQSVRVQSIFQGMRDSLKADMAKNEEKETEAKNNYDEFSSIKTTEHKTLKHQLVASTSELAEKKKALSDTQDMKDKTEKQLAADEELFADTKENCEKK